MSPGVEAFGGVLHIRRKENWQRIRALQLLVIEFCEELPSLKLPCESFWCESVEMHLDARKRWPG